MQFEKKGEAFESCLTRRPPARTYLPTRENFRQQSKGGFTAYHHPPTPQRPANETSQPKPAQNKGKQFHAVLCTLKGSRRDRLHSNGGACFRGTGSSSIPRRVIHCSFSLSETKKAVQCKRSQFRRVPRVLPTNFPLPPPTGLLRAEKDVCISTKCVKIKNVPMHPVQGRGNTKKHLDQ